MNKTIYEYIVNNRNRDLHFWENEGGFTLHNHLIKMNYSEFSKIYHDVIHWGVTEQNILTDCLAYGLDGKFITAYDNDKRIIAMKIYGQLPEGFRHPEVKKWQKNYKIHSKTKSKNFKILSIHNLILKEEYTDSDYWSLGGGSEQIQNILNNFTENDWEELKTDILHWTEDQRNIVLESIGYGFDSTFTRSLNRNMISYGGNFLLDMFCIIENVDMRLDIAYFSLFINKSNTSQIDKLKLMRNWMSANGFNNPEWINSSINPLGNIDDAIEKILNKNSKI